MSVISGDSGRVEQDDTVVTGVQKWSIDYTGEPTSFVASNTKKGTVRLAGNNDWSGKLTGLGAIPPIIPGVTFSFDGAVDGTNGASGDAICEEVVINWDVEAGGIITYEMSFSSNGALTLGAVTAAADTAVPASDLTSILADFLELGLAHSTTPAYAAVSDVRTAQLTISRAAAAYVSSSTAGQTKRVAGPWDAEFTYSLYEGDPANLILPGTEKFVRISNRVAATATFWELKAMMFGDISGLEVDIETGALISATQTCKMSAFYTDGLAGAVTEGSIDAPGVVQWWP